MVSLIIGGILAPLETMGLFSLSSALGKMFGFLFHI